MKIILSAVLLATASVLCFGQGKVAPPPTVTPLTILAIMGPMEEVGAALTTTAPVTEAAPAPTVTAMTILAIMPMQAADLRLRLLDCKH